MRCWLVLAFAAFGGAAGCKSLTEARLEPAVEIDTRLASLRDQFLADATSANVTIPGFTVSDVRVMKFVDDIASEKAHYGVPVGDDGDTVGTCARLDEERTLGVGSKDLTLAHYGWQEIWIEKSYADDPATTDAQLKEVVYHELGHCLMGLGHAPDEPHHIMSPYVSPSGAWVKANWTSLVNDLFTGRH